MIELIFSGYLAWICFIIGFIGILAIMGLYNKDVLSGKQALPLTLMYTSIMILAVNVIFCVIY